ncbi:MAG: polysaccharide deacetylase family protein [Pedobacter sp.]
MDKLKKLILIAMSAVTPRRIRPRVVYYHSIHPSDKNSMHPDTFKSHLQWLIEHEYNIMSLTKFMNAFFGGSLPDRSVAVTFDDGYLDNFEFAIPILLDLKLEATFFVVSGLIDSSPTSSNKGYKLLPDKLMLNKGMLREMHSFGMEIGSHSRTHANIRQTLETSANCAGQEAYSSKTDLEEILGENVTSFAYPNGQRGVFSDNTLSLLRKAGYQYGATTIWGSIGSSVHPLEIPRIEVRNNDSFQMLARKLTGKYDLKRLSHITLNNTKRW